MYLFSPLTFLLTGLIYVPVLTSHNFADHSVFSTRSLLSRFCWPLCFSYPFSPLTLMLTALFFAPVLSSHVFADNSFFLVFALEWSGHTPHRFYFTQFVATLNYLECVLLHHTIPYPYHTITISTTRGGMTCIGPVALGSSGRRPHRF